MQDISFIVLLNRLAAPILCAVTDAVFYRLPLADSYVAEIVA